MFRIRDVAPTLLLVSVIGCSGGTGPGTGGVIGTWTLRTIGGQAVPKTIYEGNDVRNEGSEVLGSTLVLRENGTFTVAVNFRDVPGQGQAHIEDMDGSYTLVGAQLTLDHDSCCFAGGPQDSPVIQQATYQGGAISITFPSGTWRFTR